MCLDKPSDTFAGRKQMLKNVQTQVDTLTYQPSCCMVAASV